MDEALRRQYLRAMGIDLWESRDTPVSAPQRTPPPPVMADDDAVPQQARERIDATALPDAALEQVPPPWLEQAPLPDDDWMAATRPDDAGGAPLPPEGTETLGWASLRVRVAECRACVLHESRQHTVFGIGDEQAQLMVIGEAPGAEEDRRGEPFVGRAGKLLDAMLLAIGLRRDQVFIANILKCRPPDNRDPRPEEALRCQPFLARQVALVQPRVILAVGRVAAQNLLQSHEAVGRMRGREHRFGDIPVIVSYHPAYLLRSPEQKAKSWQDLQRAAKLLRS